MSPTKNTPDRLSQGDNGNIAPVTIPRNDQIANLLREGLVPMLPFEALVLHQELDGHSKTQSELGKLLGQAMEQSSETWHDNAPADAINAAAGILAYQANNAIKTLKFRSELDYPTVEDESVTLGSLVTVRFANGDEDTFYLTGHAREVPQVLTSVAPEDTTAININSPLGKALLGMNLGETVTYTVNGRELQVEIVGFAQFNGTSLE